MPALLSSLKYGLFEEMVAPFLELRVAIFGSVVDNFCEAFSKSVDDLNLIVD